MNMNDDKYEQMVSYLQAQDAQPTTAYTCRVAKTEAEMRLARRRVRDLSVRCL